jgi:hypothetical protein
MNHVGRQRYRGTGHASGSRRLSFQAVYSLSMSIYWRVLWQLDILFPVVDMLLEHDTRPAKQCRKQFGDKYVSMS